MMPDLKKTLKEFLEFAENQHWQAYIAEKHCWQELMKARCCYALGIHPKDLNDFQLAEWMEENGG